MSSTRNVIEERIREIGLRAYLVGFDINDNNIRFYRLNDLAEILTNLIPEFALAYHAGTKFSLEEFVKLSRDAAKSIYKIKEFDETRKIYENNECIEDDDKDKHYLKRGEFGELILYCLLRDFNDTVPLLSKIYFKDAYGSTVHGFDAVHIQPESETLWLGESKLYINGKKGIQALISDLKNHFKRDYLNEEFAIISKKIKEYDDDNIPEKETWLQIMDKHKKLIEVCKSVCIPILCTYSSDVFSNFDDETTNDFINAYEAEIRDLKQYFDNENDHPLKSRLNIILLLFPVKCKNALVKKMHERLYHMQEM